MIAMAAGAHVENCRGSMIIPNSPNDLATLFVSAVQDSTQFIVFLQEGVGLVDQQRWSCHFDDAEHDCHCRI